MAESIIERAIRDINLDKSMTELVSFVAAALEAEYQKGREYKLSYWTKRLEEERKAGK